MKIDELVTEAGWLGRVGAGIKGALMPGQSRAGAVQRKAQEQEIDQLAKQDFPNWVKMESDLLRSGIPQAELGKYIQRWAQRYYEGAPVPAYTGAYSQNGAMQYIKNAIRVYNTRHLLDQPAANVAPTTANVSPATTGNATPVTTKSNIAPTTANVSPTTTGNAAPVTTTATTANVASSSNVAANTTSTVSSTSSTETMFKDPQQFKAEWDKYAAAKGQYALITNPKLLSVLKTMWMKSGGLRAESKNRKGKQV